MSYIARPAVSTERLTEDKNGELIYELKRRWKNGVTAIKLAPHEFLERLFALVPPFYSHTVRYSGAYGSAARNRNKVTLERIPGANKKTSNPETKNVRIPWAQLLKKVFSFDLTVCLRCGKPTHLIGTVFGKSAIKKILDCLKHDSDPPDRGGGTNGWGAPLQEFVHPYAPEGDFTKEEFSDFGV